MFGTEFNIVLKSLTSEYFRFPHRHVDICTTHAYFYVGQSSTRLCIIENLSYFVHSLTCKYFRFWRCHVELYTIRAYFGVGLCITRLGNIENMCSRRNRLPTFVICGFITNSCLEASLCRHFVFRLITIIGSCRLVIILAKNRGKECSGIFFTFYFYLSNNLIYCIATVMHCFCPPYWFPVEPIIVHAW